LMAGYMPEEYRARGHCSTKTDAFSFAVVLLELLTGQPHTEVIELLFNDYSFFKNISNYLDPKAGNWPKKVVKVLTAIAEKCHAHHPRDRVEISTVLPKLQGLSR
jgi:hypothetical protein